MAQKKEGPSLDFLKVHFQSFVTSIIVRLLLLCRSFYRSRSRLVASLGLPITTCFIMCLLFLNNVIYIMILLLFLYDVFNQLTC